MTAQQILVLLITGDEDHLVFPGEFLYQCTGLFHTLRIHIRKWIVKDCQSVSVWIDMFQHRQPEGQRDGISCSICASALTLNGWFRNSRRRSISISTIFSSGSISFTLTGISTPSFLHVLCICLPVGLNRSNKISPLRPDLHCHLAQAGILRECRLISWS